MIRRNLEDANKATWCQKEASYYERDANEQRLESEFMMFLPDIKFFSTLAVTKDFIVCTLANLPRYEFQIGQIPPPRSYKSTWKTHQCSKRKSPKKVAFDNFYNMRLERNIFQHCDLIQNKLEKKIRIKRVDQNLPILNYCSSNNLTIFFCNWRQMVQKENQNRVCITTFKSGAIKRIC